MILMESKLELLPEFRETVMESLGDAGLFQGHINFQFNGGQYRRLLVTVILILLSIFFTTVAQAHEGREVGPYVIVVGFRDEPALEGFLNGIDLQVEVAASGEAVEGLQDSLQMELLYVPSGDSKVFDLEPIIEAPGHYTADFIPTAPGEYWLRFFGTIDELAVDETFESGHDTFSDVETAQDIQFPNPVPQARELESAVRGAQQAAGEAQDSAAAATLLAAAALVLGLIGAVAGLLALLMVRRRT
jgi:hypothetical protein